MRLFFHLCDFRSEPEINKDSVSKGSVIEDHNMLVLTGRKDCSLSHCRYNRSGVSCSNASSSVAEWVQGGEEEGGETEGYRKADTAEEQNMKSI